MRRLRAMLVASVLSHGCVPGLVNGSGDTSMGSAECHLDDVCAGGGAGGVADEVVAVAVVGVVVGAVAVAVYRRLVHGASR